MALTNGPKLGLLVNGDIGEEHYDELMAQWRGLDALIQASVIDNALTAPPVSPADGDTYIVAASATGDWATHDGKIARWNALSPGAWEFFTPKVGWWVWVESESGYFVFNGSTWGSWGSSPKQAIQIAVSDESTALTTGTAKVTFRMPYAFTLTDVRASVTTAPTGADLKVDVNVTGTGSILSTVITIEATEKSSVDATTQPVISSASLADDAEVTIDIDQIGSTIAGAGLKVTLIGYPT